jgi:subtilisin-like proprotein convertase family protein
MKITTLKVLATAALVLAATFSQAQSAFTNQTFTSVNTAIPDGNPTGFASSTNLSGVVGTVTSVTVTLDITGGFNGDLYAYLAGPASGFAVLLNRTGITGSNPVGYSDAGFNITLSDGSPNIHLYQLDSPTFSGGQLTGTWAPDGRNIDPQSSGSTFDSASTGTDLSSFDGNTANGSWTLFIADMSSGGQATLVSWGLTVVTVPEPQTWVLAAGGVGVLLALNRRRKL